MEAIKGLFPNAILQKSDSGATIEFPIGCGAASLHVRMTVAAQAHEGKLEILDKVPDDRLESILARWNSIARGCDFLDPLQPLRCILTLQFWWAKQNESCPPALTSVGIPDDVVDIIFTLLDPVDIMRVGLTCTGWLAQVDRESLWAHLFAFSGFSLSSFSLKMCKSSKEKYALAFQARQNMRNHRAQLRSLSDPSVFPNLDWASFLLDASIRVGTSRYLVYHLSEMVQFSSYESQQCRGAVFVDLEHWPERVEQIPYSSDGPRAPTFAMVGQNRAMSVNDNVFVEVGGTEVEMPRFGRHMWSSMINSDARYPWLLHFLSRDYGGEDGPKKFIVYDVDSKEIALGPFLTPGGKISHAGELVGPWIVDCFSGPWALVTQSFRDYTSRIDVFNLAQAQRDAEPQPIASFSRATFPLPSGCSEVFILPRLGPNGLLVVAVRFKFADNSVKFALYIWDFSAEKKQFSEDLFLASELPFEIPGEPNNYAISEVIVSNRYAVVTLGYTSLVIDIVAREPLTVLYTSEGQHRCTPIDSTLFLLNTARKIFGIDFARGIAPLPARTPTFALLVNDSTNGSNVQELQFHSSARTQGRKFFDSLLSNNNSNFKYFVDVIEDDKASLWRTYVVHKFVAAKVGSMRIQLEKVQAALSNADLGSKTAATFSASSPVSTSQSQAETSSVGLVGHSRSGAHARVESNTAPAATSATPEMKANQSIEAIAFKIGKAANATRESFVFCDLTPAEADAAFAEIRKRLSAKKK